MGQATQGQGLLPAGIGSVSVAGQAWHPTILYLLGLLIVEMFVFGFIGRILK